MKTWHQIIHGHRYEPETFLRVVGWGGPPFGRAHPCRICLKPMHEEAVQLLRALRESEK